MLKVDDTTRTSDATRRPVAITSRRRPDLPPPRGRSLSVLVVGDLADAAGGLAQALELLGFPSRPVPTGAAARVAITSDPPDVVVLNFPSRVVDGWELARWVVAGHGPAAKRPLLVAVTEGGSDEGLAAEAGVDLVLVGPVEPAVVVGVLRRFARAVAPGRTVPSPP